MKAAVLERSSDRSQPSQVRGWLPIASILVVSVAALIACLLARPMVIESEGAYYARVAENLAAGVGWIGMHAWGVQLLYPPLFPLLIAGVHLMGPNVELAARLVSLFFGSLLVIPVFLIAEGMYGQRVGQIAALMTALHPVLVGASVAVLSEASYTFFLFTGILCSILAARSQYRWTALGAGVVFGLAYLIRPEALLLTLVTAAIVVLYGWKHRSKAIQVAICQIAAFAILAAPYVVFLKVQTGQFRLEGKSSSNFLLSQMLMQGMSLNQVNYAIDDDLTPRGLNMRSDLEVIHSTKFDLATSMRMIRTAAGQNTRLLFIYLTKEQACGGALLMGLVMLGLFGSAWNRERAAGEGVLITILVFLVVPLFSLIFFNSRFVIPFLPLLIVWAAKGVDEFAKWSQDTAHNLLPGSGWATRTGLIASGCALGGMLLIGWATVQNFPDLRRDDLAVKTLGLQLKRQFPGIGKIMDVSPIPAFYAGAVVRNYPYTDSSTALRYIAASKIDLLVLREHGSEMLTPYLKDWQTNGVPDPRAELLLTVPTQEYGQIKVYRWRQ